MPIYEIHYIDNPLPEYVDAVDDTIMNGVFFLQSEEVNTVIPLSAIRKIIVKPVKAEKE